MAFDVTPLQAQLLLFRPDLENRTARLRYCLDEAVREVCRRTFLARETITTTLTAGDRTLTPTLTTGRNLLKVHRLDFQDPTTSEWILVSEFSFKAMQGDSREINSNGDTPSGWSQQGGTVRIYPGLTANMDLRLECSYVPTDGPDLAPLPEIAAQAVTEKALCLALLVPGPDRDPRHAADRNSQYHRHLGNLKAIGDFGEGGEVMAYIPPIPGVN